MKSLRTDERGMALLLAMLAIVVIGALVSGTFFAGRMEMVSGRNTVYAVQAAEAAEAGLAAAFSPWDRAWNSFPVGVDQALAPVAIPGPTRVQYTTTVRRMQGGVYLIQSVGQKLDLSGNILATRMLAKLGKHEESQRLAARLSSIRKTPPFHYFRSGVEAMRREDYALARDLFQKEVKRAPYYDEFNYWLGMAYLKLGDHKAARAQLELALKNSSAGGSRNKYSAKLRHMKSLRGSDS